MARADLQLTFALAPAASDLVGEFEQLAGRALTAQIDLMVRKYLGILRFSGPLPEIVVVRPSVNRHWRGRCSYLRNRPTTTTIEIDEGATKDARTLERVVAHETIHHVVAMTMNEAEKALAALGTMPDGDHGPKFRAGMAAVNAVMGPDFVTVYCPKDYELAPMARDVYVLIRPAGERFAWAWAARLSPEAVRHCKGQMLTAGAKLVRTRDRRLVCRGAAKIRRYGGFSLPKDPADPVAALLADLYKNGQKVDP